MKFAVLTEPYRFEMKELPVPEPANDDVLIATKKVGIGDMDQRPLPRILLQADTLGCILKRTQSIFLLDNRTFLQ